MNQPPDPSFDQRIADWLEDDPDRAPSTVLQAVLAAHPSIPQRRRWRVSWRFPTVNRIALIAAPLAILVLAGAAVLLLPGLGPDASEPPGGSAPPHSAGQSPQVPTTAPPSPTAPSSISSPTAAATSSSPLAAPPPDGRLVYQRLADGYVAVIVNPDGTGEQVLVPNLNGTVWSPDGLRLMVDVQSPQGLAFAALVNSNGSNYLAFDSPDPTLQLGCGAWSPDGFRLACAGWDDTDVARNGIYTVRASDGGDLTRITTNPDGLHDMPSDYSPDGTQNSF